MVVAALVLSLISIVVTVVSVYFGKRSADAAGTATNIERLRQHAEMRPRFLAKCDALNSGGEQRRLVIKLLGPGELESLDEITVTLRDDSHFRLKPAPRPGQPEESVVDQVWGPMQFVPGTGPGVTTRRGAVGADLAGRSTTSVGMPVGEEHVYALQPTTPPSHASWDRQEWLSQVGSDLRLRIDSRKIGWDSWVAVGELDVGDGRSATEFG